MEMMKKEGEGNTLNSDIMEHHILPLLPAKSLFRFKSVCKRWLSLISGNPVFVRQHCQSLKVSSSGLVFERITGELMFISTDQTPIGVPDPTLSFMGFSASSVISCGGLLCGIVTSHGQKNVWLCNPVTQEITYIPIPLKLYAIGLAFYPSSPTAPYHIVSPYTRRTNIRCAHSHSHFEYGFEVFSSDTQVWRQSKKKIIVPSPGFFSNRSVFVGGILYFEVGYHDVLWFDPENDLVGVIPLPVFNRKILLNCIGEWDGRLCYTGVMLNEVEIWVMKDFQWSKRYCVKLESIVEGNTGVFAFLFHTMNLRSRKASDIKQLEITPLPFSGGDELLLWVRRNLFSYNIKTGEAIRVHVCDDFRPEKCFPYINSLVPLPKQGSGL